MFQKQKPTDELPISSLADFMVWVEAQEELLQRMNHSFALPDAPRFELYFRGVDSDSYPSDDPSIFRDFGWIRSEDVFINECLSRNPRDFSGDKTTFDVLVRMQHYGVPTRLLDITKNPLVALYFSIRSNKCGAGKVVAYFVSEKKIYYPNSPLVSLYSNLAYQNYEQWRLDSRRDIAMRDLIRRASSDVIASDEFYLNQNLDGCCCVKPRMTNERIVRQDGAFLLFGMSFNKEFCPKIFPMRDYVEVGSLGRVLFLLKDRYLVITSEKKKALEDFLEREIEKHYFKFNWIAQWERFEETAKREIKKKGETWTKGIMLNLKYFFCLDREVAGLHSELGFHFNRIKYAGYEDIVKTEEIIESRRKFDVVFLKYSKLKSIKEYFKGDGYITKIEIRISGKEKMRKDLGRLGITEDKLFPELNVRANILKERFKERFSKKKLGITKQNDLEE